MTSIGKRRAARVVPVVLALLIAVLCGRHLIAAAQPLATPPLKGTPTLSASDHGLLAVVARVPVPVSEARLDLGANAPVLACALLTLLCAGALTLGRGRTVLDMLGVRCRRRGPPALLVI